MTNELKDHLTEEENKTLNKLSMKQMIRLSGFTQRLYNNLCASCKARSLNNPKSIQKYSSLCDECRSNDNIINVFHGLEELNKEIKGKK